jgi:hypothetical protein
MGLGVFGTALMLCLGLAPRAAWAGPGQPEHPGGTEMVSPPHPSTATGQRPSPLTEDEANRAEKAAADRAAAKRREQQREQQPPPAQPADSH